jgi:hypothetical protein
MLWIGSAKMDLSMIGRKFLIKQSLTVDACTYPVSQLKA